MLRVEASARKTEGGFTLIELLVVLVLLGIIGAFVANSVAQGLRADAQARSRIEASEDMQIALERMSREIRAADPVRAAGDDSIEVQVRYGEIDLEEIECRRITYERDPGDETILRSTTERFDADCGPPATGSSTEVVLLELDPASGPIFSYRDNDNRPLDDIDIDDPDDSDINDIGLVEITLTRTLPFDQPAVTLSTLVGLRNQL